LGKTRTIKLRREKMRTIEIEKIKLKDNVRIDFGDLTELTASIKRHGVRNPVEINSDNELVDGFRRVKAAKAAGLKTIPCFVNVNVLNKTTSQIISGIFQKNLNPVEEGKAFRAYMDKKKISAEFLAKVISKTKQYIEKRLLIETLPDDVKKALISKKILMGHALLLAKFPKQESSKYLKEIVRNKHSVEEAREHTEYRGFSERISEAQFDKTECKNCKYNGSVQSELFETGKILTGTCMNIGCFRKKVKEFVKEMKEKYKDILFSGPGEPKGYVNSEYTWKLEDCGINKRYMEKCKKNKDYLVKVEDSGKVIEYFKIPQKKDKSKSKSVEKQAEENRKESLMSKVSDYKKDFLERKTIELMSPGTKQTKALAVIFMIQKSNWNEIDMISKGLGNMIRSGYGNSNVPKICGAKEKDLEKAIALLSKRALNSLDMKELIEVSRSFGVDINKHFTIDEEFLKLHTKAQLQDLIKEFKLEEQDLSAKKEELIKFILSSNTKGKIPRSIK
jgi:ParB/RepB/Spo0J family partition protein